MRHRRVLVVDDSDLARTLLGRVLSREGFEVLEARDGVEGAIIALRELPHAVVTDLEMPKMDGYQLVRLLKSDEAARQIPVLILTSNSAVSSRFWGLRTGAESFMTKDRPEDVAAEIARLALPADFPFPATDSAPQGPLDILARVAKQLDLSLFEATVVETLLERGIATGELRDTCAVVLRLVGEILDAPLMAVGLRDAQETLLHVVTREATAPALLAEIKGTLLADLGGVGAGEAQVKVETVPGDFGDGLDVAQRVVFRLPVREATAMLVLLPRDRDQFELTSRQLLQAMINPLALILDNARLADRLRQQSCRDSLTGLHNRRAILEILEHEIDRARRYKQSLAIVLGDLDHFKQINDGHGHLAGDTALRVASRTFVDSLRTADSIGRYGGEEFLAVLPHADIEAARCTAERLRQNLAARIVEPADGATLRITASFGVASVAEIPPEAPVEQLIGLADARMYEAKAAGRNRVWK